MKIEKVNYKNKFEMNEVKKILEKNSLKFDESCDYTILMRNDNDKVVATVSKSRNTLKCFAIDDSIRGQGGSGILVTNILNKIFDEGYNNSFVFTKISNKEIFENIGYKEVVSTDSVSLLEIGINNIEKSIENIKKTYDLMEKKQRAMLVMNCNPFTLGHQYIVEKASFENEEVIVFVVEEDKSVFTFKVRYELVKNGCSHLKNVKVIPGTEYIISNATFPNYFLKKEDDSLIEYTKLDVTIAGKIFAPKLGITKRYVGEEPFCPMTSKYNETIIKFFPKFGIEVIVVPRKEIEERAISATEVRKILASEDIGKLKLLVPKTTYDFLISDSAKEIIKKIKDSK